MNLLPSYNSHEYTTHYNQVETVNAIYDGVDSASQYLSQFPREVNSAYIDRKSKATLKNFVKRVAISTRNIAVNRPPEIEVNAKMVPMLDKIDRFSSIELFIRELMLKVVLDGFTYVVVDAPKTDDSIQTRSDEQKNDIRPYMYIVDRNSVVNWKLKADGTFSRLTIRESYISNEGRYDDEYKEQHRVYLDDGTIEIWRQGAMVETIKLGVDFVPVVKVGSSDVPLLYDIAKLNINYMNRRSNLDRYLTIASLPVPVIYGSTSDSSVVIGVDDAISFDNKSESGFEWVEITGSSLKALHEDLLSIEESILAEAVSLTTDNDNIAKNTEQVNSENLEGFGRLNQLVVETETGINTALSFFGKFMNIDDAGFITLSKEFNNSTLSIEQVKNIIALHASGLISLDTALQSLIEGQVIEIEDIESEKAKINDIQQP